MKPIYSIYDSVAGFYSPVFQAENDAHAQRMFIQSIDLAHKADFALWRLGTFDTDNGTIQETKVPTLVVHGKNLEDKQTQTGDKQ